MTKDKKKSWFSWQFLLIALLIVSVLKWFIGRGSQMQQFIIYLGIALITSTLGVSNPIYAAEVWTSFDQDRVPQIEIAALALDSQGNRWIGTATEGIIMINKNEGSQRFRKSSHPDFMLSDTINQIAVDPQGVIWFATSKGLVRYERGMWSNLASQMPSGHLPGSHILSLGVLDAETRWIGTNQGFSIFTGGLWNSYNANRLNGLIQSLSVTALLPLSSTQAWIGTTQGLYFFDNGKFEAYTPAKTKGGLPHSYITDLEKDSLGQLWVGTQNGVGVFDGSKWKAFLSNQNEWVLGDIVYDIQLAYGEIWVAFKGGASRNTVDGWVAYDRNSTAAGLPSIRVHSILALSPREIWFGTRRGLARLQYTSSSLIKSPTKNDSIKTIDTSAVQP